MARRRRRRPLPMHGNLPVPWVARRKSERPSGVVVGATVSRGVLVETGEERNVLNIPDWWRDEYGWLWYPGPEDEKGVPEFAQVHPERQRRAMDELRCQVCGEQAPGNLRWLVPGVPKANRDIITAHAPVCGQCEGIARHFCPHLRDHKWTTIVARTVERYGVIGDVFDLAGNIVFAGVLADTHPQASMAAARQRVVVLKDWRPIG